MTHLPDAAWFGDSLVILSDEWTDYAVLYGNVFALMLNIYW
jgi:hypothetical protein